MKKINILIALVTFSFIENQAQCMKKRARPDNESAKEATIGDAVKKTAAQDPAEDTTTRRAVVSNTFEAERNKTKLLAQARLNLLKKRNAEKEKALKALTEKAARINLHDAVYHGNPLLVKLVLQRGFDLNEISPEYDATPLQIAVNQGHIAVTKVLLKKPGVNPHLKTDSFPSPFFMACSGDNPAMLTAFFAHPLFKPNAEEPDTTGLTPLDVLLINKQDMLVILLLNHTQIHVSERNLIFCTNTLVREKLIKRIVELEKARKAAQEEKEPASCIIS